MNIAAMALKCYRSIVTTRRFPASSVICTCIVLQKSLSVPIGIPLIFLSSASSGMHEVFIENLNWWKWKAGTTTTKICLLYHLPKVVSFPKMLVLMPYYNEIYSIILFHNSYICEHNVLLVQLTEPILNNFAKGYYMLFKNNAIVYFIKRYTLCTLYMKIVSQFNMK